MNREQQKAMDRLKDSWGTTAKTAIEMYDVEPAAIVSTAMATAFAVATRIPGTQRERFEVLDALFVLYLAKFTENDIGDLGE